MLTNPGGVSHQVANRDNAHNHETGTIIPVKKIVAVVVSFNPDKGSFTELLEALLPQVACTIVVDNASSPDITTMLGGWMDRNVVLLQLSENIGIAAAQNSGIERAMGFGADFVLLLDQDSIPSKSMVAELLTVILSACGTTQDRPVAAVGPARIDRRTRQQSFFMVHRAGLLRPWKADSQHSALPPFIETEFLMASGSLIPIEVIKCIGSMRSNYFIDHVDREWCFRAKAAGYRLLGVPNSILEHQIGDTVKRVGFFFSLQVSWHPPLRNYYIFRNAILMQRDVGMSAPWKFYFLWRLLRYAVGVLIMARERRRRLHYITMGIFHGYKGMGGRLDSTCNQCSSVPSSPLEPNP